MRHLRCVRLHGLDVISDYKKPLYLRVAYAVFKGHRQHWVSRDLRVDAVS